MTTVDEAPGDEAAGAVVEAPETITCPFVGPRSFVYGEHLFGRRTELHEIRDLLIAQRVLLLYSPSGAGKSSLLEAALRPELEQRKFRVLPTVRVSRDTPPSMAELTVRNRYVLSTLLSLEEGRPAGPLLDRTELATISLIDYLERDREPFPGDSILFFDQFEELFTLDATDVDQKWEFVEELGEALRDRGRWALIAMQEEYIARLDDYVELLPTSLRNHCRLDLLTVPAAISAIRDPAAEVGVDITLEAAGLLVDELRSVPVHHGSTKSKELGRYIEPVQLQVVCRQLWNRPRANAAVIELEDVKALGDIAQPLGDYYDEQVASAAGGSTSAERQIRDWFEHALIVDGIRTQVPHPPDYEGGAAAVKELLQAHLVRGEDRRGGTWYELAHDTLVGPVVRSNEEWSKRNLSMLQRQAASWADNHQRDDLLLSSTELLREAEEWAAQHPHDLQDIDREFLERSRQRARETRRTRLFTRAAFIGGGLAFAGLIFSLLMWNRAVNEKHRAEAFEHSAKWLAASNGAEDGRVSSLAWINAVQTYPGDVSDVASQFDARADSVLHYLRHDPIGQGPIFSLSSDGKQMALAAADGRVNIVDLATGRRQPLTTVAQQPSDMNFDKFGSNLTIIVPDGGRSTLERWSPTGNTPLARFEIRSSDAIAPNASADGRTVAFLSRDNTADADAGELIIVDGASGSELYRSATNIQAIGTPPAISADGARVAVVGTDHCLHLVTKETGGWAERKLSAVCDLSVGLAAIAIDRAGQLAAAARDDGSLAVARLDDGHVSTTTGNGDVIIDAAFLPDGSLRTVDRGGKLRTWSLAGDTFTEDAAARESAPIGTGAVLAGDGQRAAVWDAVAGLQVYDVVTGRVLMGQHALSTPQVDVGRPGRLRIDSAGTAVLADWEGRERWHTPEGIGPLRSAAFSAGDGKYVVVATDSSMLVLDASDGHTVDQQALATSGADPSAAGAVGGIAASSDARTIVMERGKELASWNRVDKRVTELSDGSQITTIAVSADGMRVAAGVTEGDRHEIWVWADGKAEPQKLASRSVVTAVDLSSEGQLYAGTLEGTVTSWDLLTDDSAGQQLSYDLDGAVVDLETAGKQTDGTLLETVATNRTVAVYDLYNSYHERQDPTKALRQIHLYPTEGDVLRARLDGDQLHVAESDGFTYTLENVSHQVDVGTTLEEAERLRDQSGLRLTTAECADADLPCPKD